MTLDPPTPTSPPPCYQPKQAQMRIKMSSRAMSNTNSGSVPAISSLRRVMSEPDTASRFANYDSKCSSIPHRSNAYGVECKEAQVGPSDFTKIKLLGAGDAGKVYLVQENRTGRNYALKVLAKAEMVKRNKVKRALAELAILSTANHPFIVPLHHSFQTKNYLCFCLEFCAGGEFFAALHRRPGRVLKEHEAKFYAAEVVAALEYLHLMGVVFRDLKPENILLHESGHVMLSDFDLSIQSTSATPPKVVWSRAPLFSSPLVDTRTCTHLRTNSFVGTEEYIAPEIIRGSGHSSAVDWWTLGILVFEMLFGHTPFKGETRDDTFERVLHHHVEFPDFSTNPFYSGPNVSGAAKSIIRQLLHKNENKRLGARAGASQVKSHSFFRSINFALLRHMRPPIVPTKAKASDAIHFAPLRESTSFDLVDAQDNQSNTLPATETGQESPSDTATEDPFAHFSSVTLYRRT